SEPERERRHEKREADAQVDEVREEPAALAPDEILRNDLQDLDERDDPDAQEAPMFARFIAGAERVDGFHGGARRARFHKAQSSAPASVPAPASSGEAHVLSAG